MSSAATTAKPKGAMSILRELGIKGMYKGASACFLRDVPFSGTFCQLASRSSSTRATTDRPGSHNEQASILAATPG
jgi:hypothetical protein